MNEKVKSYREKAAELYESEKYRDVISLLTEQILETCKDAELYAWRSRAHYICKDDINISMSYAQKAIEVDDRNFMGYLARGDVYRDVSDIDKAIADYSKVIELRSDYAYAYYSRGNAYYDKSEIDKAIADYNKVIELNPDYAVVYNNRGNAWGYKKELDKAIVDYNKAIELNPDYATAYFNRAIIYSNKADISNAIADYSKAIELNPNYGKAYYNRGVTYMNMGEIDKAIVDYNKAIELNPDYAQAYNNRGNARTFKKELDKAIADYNKAIELNPNYSLAHNNRGNAWKEKGDIDKAMLDYNKAIEINPQYEKAYYNKGLLGKLDGRRLDERIIDFKKYLELTKEKDSIWAKRADVFIKEFEEKIRDNALREIGDIAYAIKKLLLIREGCITHYTGLTVSKKLLIEEQNGFRISEGSFLNDTSEGTELFKFLGRQLSVRDDGLIAETFTPKPFIGSFVSETKHDDLNLWRFYGKENGVEAKGCAITLKLKEFIDAINFSINKGDDKVDASSEDDINFYRVAYWNHESSGINFHIPNSKKKEEKELSRLMIQLKEKVSQYNESDTSILEKYLNNIAFLFKSDAYKNENELRLVVKGIEFDKKMDMDTTPPRVYIELVNIRKLVEQITIGPKVERAEEWAAAFHYSYDEERVEDRPKKIIISKLPYK